MFKYRINCPCCGHMIDLFVNDAGELTLRHFDISSEIDIDIARNYRYELGTDETRKEV